VWTRGRKTNRCKNRIRERQTHVKKDGEKDRQTEGRQTEVQRQTERKTDIFDGDVGKTDRWEKTDRGKTLRETQDADAGRDRRRKRQTEEMTDAGKD
jgi:hypothetical protein